MARPAVSSRDRWVGCAQNAGWSPSGASASRPQGGPGRRGRRRGRRGAVRLWPGADPSVPPVDRPHWPSPATWATASASSRCRSTVRWWRGGARPWETEGLGSTPYSMLALTWQDPGDSPVLEVRTRARRPLVRLAAGVAAADLPDAGSEERVTVGSTDLIWTGASDGVQVRVGGLLPAGSRWSCCSPGRGPRTPSNRRRSSPARRPRAPAWCRDRACADAGSWGADERWRDG